MLATTSTSGSAGLIEANEEPAFYLEPIYLKYCSKLSRADFWALWGKSTAEKSAASLIAIDFYYRRTDNNKCTAGSGRLPNAVLGLNLITQVSVNQMGLTMADAVVLMGAHSVGHMSNANSGFGLNGVKTSWDNTPAVLDNEFYRDLILRP